MKIFRVCISLIVVLAVAATIVNGCGGAKPTSSTYSISGTVTLSGTGLQGVTMTLAGASSGTVTTDASGNYGFTGLSNGSYTITPSQSGYTFSPSSSAQTVNGANITGVNFTSTQGKLTLRIGLLTDLTGLASPALQQTTYITEDMIRYYNDENFIPGVTLGLDVYDTGSDPARYSLGYDWCKGKGDDLIITVIGDAALLLKPYAERDKIVLAAMAGSPEMFTPPGWIFGFSSNTEDSAKTLLHWIVGNDWPNKGQGTPRISIIGWDDTQSIIVGDAVEAYLEAHPDEYELVDRLITPVGTSTFTSEALKLKNDGVDYVAVVSSTMFAASLRDLRAAGSQATLLDCVGSMGSFQSIYEEMVGWDLLDGCYSTSNSFAWTDTQDPIVQLAGTLVYRYHSASEAQDIIASGNAYVGPAAMTFAILEILQQAVKNVGAENFNGQAYYDAALNYKTTGPAWQNYPEFSFSETGRKLMDHSLITGFKGASVKDYVTISGWRPDID